MVNNSSEQLDLVFHALSDSTRREILRMLTEKEFTIGELASPFQMSLAAISKHIKVLERAELLTRARDGRIHRCTMNAAPLGKARELIQFYQRFWEDRFRDLDRYLSQPSVTEPVIKKEGKKNGHRKK